MGNMSYCRFRNTLIDLQDCVDAIETGELIDEGIDRSELQALIELRDLCEYLVNDLSGEIDDVSNSFYEKKETNE